MYSHFVNINKQKTPKINNLNFYLTRLEKTWYQTQRRRKEIIKISAEMNEIENRKNHAECQYRWNGFFCWTGLAPRDRAHRCTWNSWWHELPHPPKLKGPLHKGNVLTLLESEQEAPSCAEFVSGSWISGWATWVVGMMFEWCLMLNIDETFIQHICM